MLGCLGFSCSAVSITYAGHLTPKSPPHDGHSDSPSLAWLLHQPSLFSSWWNSWDKKMMLGLWVLCLLEQSLPSCHYAFLLASHPCAPTQISHSSALHPGHPVLQGYHSEPCYWSQGCPLFFLKAFVPITNFQQPPLPSLSVAATIHLLTLGKALVSLTRGVVLVV